MAFSQVFFSVAMPTCFFPVSPLKSFLYSYPWGCVVDATEELCRKKDVDYFSVLWPCLSQYCMHKHVTSSVELSPLKNLYQKNTELLFCVSSPRTSRRKWSCTKSVSFRVVENCVKLFNLPKISFLVWFTSSGMDKITTLCNYRSTYY